MASIEKTKYGTWRARWKDASGKQRARSFPRKGDAREFLDSLTGRPDAPPLSLREWADQWLAGARNLGQGGIDTYRRDLDRYILPALGDVTLARLQPEVIDSFINDELAWLADSTVHRHYRTINRMLNVAVEREKMPANPCKSVHPPRVQDAEMRFLAVAEIDRLAAAISPRYRAWVYLACYGGLRWSELVGLRRSSVVGARVSVTEQLVKRADGEWHRDMPKTRAGRRVLTLPGFVTDVMAAHLDEFSQPGADGLVFVNQRNSPLGASSFTGNVFKPALRRAGLDDKVRIHDLRHTAVALLIAAGAHPKAIQSRMGHASISVTLDRYGHLFPEQDEALAGALDDLRHSLHRESEQIPS